MRLPPGRTAEGRRVRSWRSFTAVLVVAMVSATFLQSALGVVSVFVIDDLGISRSRFGVILAVFGLVGAAAAPFAGRVADAVGGRRVLVALFVVAAISTIAIGASPSWVTMLPVGAMAGLALAAGNPATDKLIAVEVEPSRRGAVVGLKQAGPPLGTLIAGAALPSLAAVAGWRTAILCSAVIPVAGLAGLWRAIPPTDPGPPGESGPRSADRMPAAVWWLTSIGAAVATGVGGILAFLPLYLVERVGMSPAQAGAMVSVIGLLSVTARVAWGRRTGSRRDVIGPLSLVAAVSVASSLGFWAAEISGEWLAWVAAVSSAASMMAWHSLGALGLIARVGTDTVGRASGIVHLGSSVGFGIGPLLFGVLADAGGFDLAWAATAGTFTLATVLTLGWARREGATRIPIQ